MNFCAYLSIPCIIFYDDFAAIIRKDFFGIKNKLCIVGTQTINLFKSEIFKNGWAIGRSGFEVKYYIDIYFNQPRHQFRINEQPWLVIWLTKYTIQISMLYVTTGCGWAWWFGWPSILFNFLLYKQKNSAIYQIKGKQLKMIFSK